MKVSLIYTNYSSKLSYYDDWIDAFEIFSEFTLKKYCLDTVNESNYSVFKKEISNSELVVLHHSVTADSINLIRQNLSLLDNLHGQLAIFVGNEINMLTIRIKDKLDLIRELRPNFILTQLLQEAGNWLYGEFEFAKVLSVPHALNPTYYIPQDIKKTIDVGTRTNRCSLIIGDDDRNRILEYFEDIHTKYNLRIDLGESSFVKKRFHRKDWKNFLARCKSSISTEAGSFYLQTDDKIANNIKSFSHSNTNKIVIQSKSKIKDNVIKVLPNFSRDLLSGFIRKFVVFDNEKDEEVGFEKINNFFNESALCPAYSKCISSRHFDTIGMKCLNVMYPGRYNDLLDAGKHYFELKKDHSNIQELVELLNDDVRLRDIVDSAYEHVINNHTHRKRLELMCTHL